MVLIYLQRECIYLAADRRAALFAQLSSASSARARCLSGASAAGRVARTWCLSAMVKVVAHDLAIARQQRPLLIRVDITAAACGRAVLLGANLLLMSFSATCTRSCDALCATNSARARARERCNLYSRRAQMCTMAASAASTIACNG